jgi:hypothetical protein
VDIEQLFKIKEKMLKELALSLEGQSFESPAMREAYYQNGMEAIMNFYAELQDKIYRDAA